MASRFSTLAALAILTGAATGGAIVWATLPSPASINCGYTSSGNTPFGSALAFSPPKEDAKGTAHWYNSTIVSASGGLSLRNLVLEIQTQAGVIIVPGPQWTLNAFSVSLSHIGTFSLSGATAGNWTSGGSQPLENGQVFSLFTTPQNLSGSGYIWYVLLTGNYSDGCPASGSVSASIP